MATLKAYQPVKRLSKKVRRGFRGYPVATIAFYGPDAGRASKVAVGIVMTEGDEVADLRVGPPPTGARPASPLPSLLLAQRGAIDDDRLASSAIARTLQGSPRTGALVAVLAPTVRVKAGHPWTALPVARSRVRMLDRDLPARSRPGDIRRPISAVSGPSERTPFARGSWPVESLGDSGSVALAGLQASSGPLPSDQTARPNTWWTRARCAGMSLAGTARTCPLASIAIASTPASVRRAVPKL